jgi:hypothetical protein
MEIAVEIFDVCFGLALGMIVLAIGAGMAIRVFSLLSKNDSTQE